MSAPSRSSIHSTRLVRLLQDLLPAPASPPGGDVAERLSHWLGAFDAVQLDGALQAIESYSGQARSPGQPVDVGALRAEVQALKDALAALAAPPQPPVRSGSALRGRLADRSVLPDPQTPVPQDQGYTPHLQRYQELQKQMDTRVAECRARLRQALAKGSPRLRQLSALDAVMEQLLATREPRLLASVPVYLERRFEQRRQGGNPDVFAHDLREALSAELQVRLQPLLGLIEAAQAESQASLAPDRIPSVHTA